MSVNWSFLAIYEGHTICINIIKSFKNSTGSYTLTWFCYAKWILALIGQFSSENLCF